MSMATILVMWPGQFDKLSFPHPIWLSGVVVSAEMNKECGRRWLTEAYLYYKLINAPSAPVSY